MGSSSCLFQSTRHTFLLDNTKTLEYWDLEFLILGVGGTDPLKYKQKLNLLFLNHFKFHDSFSKVILEP